MIKYIPDESLYAYLPCSWPDDFVDLSVYLARYHYYSMSDDVTILNQAEEKLTKIVPNSDCKFSSLAGVSSITSNSSLCIAATPRDDAPCQARVRDREVWQNGMVVAAAVRKVIE